MIFIRYESLLLWSLVLIILLLIIRSTLRILDWSKKNQLFRSTIFIWIGWAVSGVLSVIPFIYLSPSEAFGYYIFFVYLINIFVNFFLLLYLQKEITYESFLFEKVERKSSESKIWKTSIILSIVTNTSAIFIGYILAEIFTFIEKMIPKITQE